MWENGKTHWQTDKDEDWVGGWQCKQQMANGSSYVHCLSATHSISVCVCVWQSLPLFVCSNIFLSKQLIEQSLLPFDVVVVVVTVIVVFVLFACCLLFAQLLLIKAEQQKCAVNCINMHIQQKQQQTAPPKRLTVWEVLSNEYWVWLSESKSSRSHEW